MDDHTNKRKTIALDIKCRLAEYVPHVRTNWILEKMGNPEVAIDYAWGVFCHWASQASHYSIRDDDYKAILIGFLECGLDFNKEYPFNCYAFNTTPVGVALYVSSWKVCYHLIVEVSLSLNIDFNGTNEYLNYITRPLHFDPTCPPSKWFAPIASHLVSHSSNVLTAQHIRTMILAEIYFPPTLTQTLWVAANESDELRRIICELCFPSKDFVIPSPDGLYNFALKVRDIHLSIRKTQEENEQRRKLIRLVTSNCLLEPLVLITLAYLNDTGEVEKTLAAFQPIYLKSVEVLQKSYARIMRVILILKGAEGDTAVNGDYIHLERCPDEIKLLKQTIEEGFPDMFNAEKHDLYHGDRRLESGTLEDNEFYFDGDLRLTVVNSYRVKPRK